MTRSPTEFEIAELERRLKAVEARNARVTADKAWETSIVRKASIAGLTYLLIASYLAIIHNEQPLINAIVPVLGYLLSTLVLAQVKSTWTGRVLRNKIRQKSNN